MIVSTFKKNFIKTLRIATNDAALWDWKTNAIWLFIRLFLSLYFIFLSLLYKSFLPIVIILISFFFYAVLAMKKMYVNKKNKNTLILLLLKCEENAAVLLGTIIGSLILCARFDYASHVKKNKYLFLIIAVYIGIWLLIFKSGEPNQYHPFPYNMDEWHQFQAVRATFKYGTPNTFGAANGTMFHFLLSGFYLVPFTLADYINPVVLTVNDWVMRERIFDLLRINTLIYGILSILVFYRVAQLVKVSAQTALSLFVFTPIWLSLSVFFKYDIALIFWILLSLLFFFRFWKHPTSRNFIFAGIVSALTLAVKISAIPIAIIYVFSYFWFYPQWKKNLRHLLAGIGVFVAFLILFGFPDTLFGKGNIVLYFLENVVYAPATSSNYELGMHPLLYLSVLHYPMIFGHGFMALFVISVLFWLYSFYKDAGFRNVNKFKVELFVYFSLLVFALSLVPLQIFAAANRSLVLLPFMVLIIAFAFMKAIKIKRVKILIIFIIVFISIIQIFESLAIVFIKVKESPQSVSSAWIERNIPQGRVIGIENVPIYQNVPDIIQKEFYFNQYKIKFNNQYKYQIIDSTSVNLPSIIVITNDDEEVRFFKQSPKKDLVQRVNKEGYKKIAVFSPDLTLYKMFNDVKDYYFYSWLIAYPHTISVYAK